MSFHLVTVFRHGARLSVDRGFLVCQYKTGEENRIVLADVRALIIAVPAVSFTNECLARLLAQDSPVLHCDNHYKPIGWTIPLERVIRREVFSNQILQDGPFFNFLWNAVVKQKMLNQAAVLDTFEVEHHLYKLIHKPLANEANVSKQYWSKYFELLGAKQKRERKNASSFENKALNYGYAVISTLVHRSILIYGMLPSLGIHHDFRYRSYPLVYDLMEPFRPFVDLLLAKWMQTQGIFMSEDDEDGFKDWVRYLMESLRTCRVKQAKNMHSYKLMDAIDQEVRSVATCFENQYYNYQDISKLWLPDLVCHYWQEEAGDTAEDEDIDRIAV